MRKTALCVFLFAIMSGFSLAQTPFEIIAADKAEFQQRLDQVIQRYEAGEELSLEESELLESSGYFFVREDDMPGGGGGNELDEILFSESFDYADITELQADGGWTVVDGGQAGPDAPWTTWTIQSTHRGTEHTLDDTAPFIIVDADRAGSYDLDESLITPAIDAFGWSSLVLSFDYAYKGYSAPNEQGDVDYSIDGGDTWTNLVTFSTPATQVIQAYPYQIELPQACDNVPDLRIRFRYYNANYDYWWGIDNVDLSGTPAYGTIVGTVTESENLAAIEGVTVTLNPGGRQTTTDAFGDYEITNQLIGNYSVTFAKFGYYSSTLPDITITENSTTTVNASLVSNSGPLMGIITTVGLENIPAEGVVVTLVETGDFRTTDATGYFDFGNIPGGSYTVSLEPDNLNRTPWLHDDQISIEIVEGNDAFTWELPEILAPQNLLAQVVDETTVQLSWNDPPNHAGDLATLNTQIEQMQAHVDRVMSNGTQAELAKLPALEQEIRILTNQRDRIERRLDNLDEISDFLGTRIWINGELQEGYYQGNSVTFSDLVTGDEYTFDVAADYGYGDEYLVATDSPVTVRPMFPLAGQWTYRETDYEWVEIHPDNGGNGISVPNWGDDENSGWLEWGTGQTFTLYDVEETGFHICSNGWISFDRASVGNTYIRPRIPDSSIPNLFASLLGIDQDTGDRNCGSWFSIDPDNSRVVVQFHNRYYSNVEPLYIYEVVLNTDDNTMLFSYQSAGEESDWHGHTPVESGIENSDGTVGSVLPNALISNETSFLFYRSADIGEWVELAGNIVNEHGIGEGQGEITEPVPGAVVTAISTSDGETFSGETDENGHYRVFLDRNRAPYDIHVSVAGFDPLIVENLALDPEFTTTYNITLTAVGSFYGTIRDGESSELVEGATVTISSQDLDETLTATSDVDGHFEFLRLLDRDLTWMVSVQAPEFHDATFDPVSFSDQDYTVEQNYTLDPLGTFTGVVLDQITNEPVCPCYVTVSDIESDETWSTMTDETGAYSIERSFDRDCSYNLLFEEAGYFSTSNHAVGFGDEHTVVVDATMTPHGTLQGSIEDVDGNPVPDAVVVLWTEAYPGEDRNAVSNADGDYEFVRQLDRDESYSIQVVAEGFQLETVHELTFAAEDYVLTTDVTLTPIDATASPSIVRTESDFDDKFEIFPLPPGVYGQLVTYQYDDDVAVMSVHPVSAGGMYAAGFVPDDGYVLTAEVGFTNANVFNNNPDATYDDVIVLLLGDDGAGCPDINNVLWSSAPVSNTEDENWVVVEPGIHTPADGYWVCYFDVGPGMSDLLLDAGLSSNNHTAFSSDAGQSWVLNPLPGDPFIRTTVFHPISDPAQAVSLTSGLIEDEQPAKGRSATEMIGQGNLPESYFGVTPGTRIMNAPLRPGILYDALGIQGAMSGELDEISGYTAYWTVDGGTEESLFTESNDPFTDPLTVTVSSDFENVNIACQITATDNEVETNRSSVWNVVFNMPPSAPTDLAFTLEGQTVTLTFTVPTTNEDGTPLVDYAGTNLYLNNDLVDFLEGTENTFVYTIEEGFNGAAVFWVKGYDEVPNLSQPSNLVNTGMFGAPDYVLGFEDEEFSIFDAPYGPDDATIWQVGIPTSGPGAAANGEYAWATYLSGNYDNNEYSMLVSEPMAVLNDNAGFAYSHYFGYETGIDGYTVLVSADGGTTWEVITPYQGYSQSDVSALGYPGFTGSIVGWQQIYFSLLDWYEPGQYNMIQVGFLHATDISVTNVGAYIDEMYLYGLGPVDDYNLPPEPFSMLTPEDGGTAWNALPVLTWEAAEDINPFDQGNITYNLWYSYNSDFSDPVEITGITDTQQTFAGLLEDTWVYWRVQAQDVGGLTTGANGFDTGCSFLTNLELDHFSSVDATANIFEIDVQAVTIDGVNLQIGDEIAIFDGQTCVGGAFVASDPMSSLAIEAYGTEEPNPGYTEGNTIRYKIWSVENQQEFWGVAEYTTGNGIFESGEAAEIVLQGVRNVDQTYSLAANYWNLVSLPVDPLDPAVSSVFSGVTSLQNIHDSYGDVFIPNIINDIGDLNYTQGYRVFCTEAEEFTLSGQTLDIDGVEYGLSQNTWNWIGYPFDFELDATVGLADIADNLEIIVDDQGAFWIPALNINTLGNLVPGEGYAAWTSETVSFAYAGGGQNHILANPDDIWIVRRPTDAPEGTGYPWTVLVDLDQDLLDAGASQIAVYDGVQLVGKSYIMEDKSLSVVTAWRGFDDLNLSGYTPGHRVTFKVLDEAGNDLRTRSKTQNIAFDESPFGSMSLAYSPLPTSFSLSEGFPNPFNPTVKLKIALPNAGKVDLAVFNILGQEVYHSHQHYEAGYHYLYFDATQSSAEMSSGIYFMQVRYEGQVNVRKLVLLK